MATARQRIQVSLSEEARRIVPMLARKRRIPTATLASHLIDEALEFIEDFALAKVADARDTKSARFVSHKVAWSHTTRSSTKRR